MEKTKKIKQALLVFMAAVMIFTSLSCAFTASAAAAKKISKCTISVSKTVAYTGKALKPKVTVKYGKTTLKSGKHYTVSYSNNKNMGTAKVTVKAKKGGGYTGSKSVNFSIVPGKVKNLKATTTTSSVTLSWSKVTGATKYTVYSYNASKKKYSKVTDVKTNKATIKKRNAGQTYSYAVKAYAVKGKKTYAGSYSSVLNCSTLPAKVSSLKLSSVGATSMKASWAKVKNATGYVVYSYNSSTKKYTKLKTVKTNSVTLTSLKSATYYRIAVRAYRLVSGKYYYGAYSSLASATTLPAQVTGLKYSATTSSVTLTWNAVSGANGYVLYSYNPSNKKYTSVQTLSTNKATVSSLKMGVTNRYAVRAFKKVSNKNYYGAYSSVITTVTLPAKVSGVKAVASDYAATVSWTAAAGAAGYNVYTYDAASKKYTKVASSTGTSAVVYNLAVGKQYSFCVEAYNSAKKPGAKSALVNATTKKYDYFTKYYNIFKSGTFSVTFTSTDPEFGNISTTFKTKNKNVAMLINSPDMEIDGEQMDMRMIYDSKKNAGYAIVANAFYVKLEKNELEGMNAELLSKMFAPDAASPMKVTEGTAKLGGKTHSTASYKTTAGADYKYFFLNGELVRVEETSKKGEVISMTITNVSGKVEDEEVSLPKGFPLGYIPIADITK